MFKLIGGSDVAAWALNVSTSVAIVFSNKVLMDPRWGYKFIFGETKSFPVSHTYLHAYNRY